MSASFYGHYSIFHKTIPIFLIDAPKNYLKIMVNLDGEGEVVMKSLYFIRC